jgi:hypothetical protein
VTGSLRAKLQPDYALNGARSPTFIAFGWVLFVGEDSFSEVDVSMQEYESSFPDAKVSRTAPCLALVIVTAYP